MERFEGELLFLDRSDINTDEIIPACYLAEVEKAALKPHLLEDLALPGFDARRDIAGKGAVLSRSNFGCGSSREHAVWALQVNGINLVIAESYSRIFRQNMYNCGLVALELPPEAVEELFSRHGGRRTAVRVDPIQGTLVAESGDLRTEHRFTLSAFDRALIEAGGWVEYADARY